MLREATQHTSYSPAIRPWRDECVFAHGAMLPGIQGTDSSLNDLCEGARAKGPGG
jgi:hypothetical protein